MGNIITHPSRNTSFTRFIKAHEYHPWQNYSFCRDNQAQRSSTTKPSWASPAHTQIPVVGDHVSWPAKFQHNYTTRAHSHQVPTYPIRSEEDTCPSVVKPFLHKLKFYHFLCDIKLKVMWQKAGKLQPVVSSFFSNPSSQELRATMTSPLKLLKQLEINSFSY